MERREFAAWLTVAFLAGSAVMPRNVVAQHRASTAADWAIRNAVAHVCELMAYEYNARHAPVRYNPARCWQ